MLKKESIKYIIAMIVIWIALLFAYKPVLVAPQKFLAAGGDGMKNYYTYMYHVRYDTTYWGFEGMNYPFGENILFTDNQPMFANAVKLISLSNSNVVDHLAEIQNLGMIFILLFCALGTFLCFRYLTKDVFLSTVFTIGLMLMHPQIARFNGHFGLFYPIFPWILFGWMQFWEGKHLKWTVIWMTIITAFFGLMHVYHFLLVSIINLIGIVCISFKERGQWTAWLSKGTILLFVPFAMIQIVTRLSHYRIDRPKDPWGFFSYLAHWEGQFFSYKLPIFHFIDENIVKIRQIEFEGKAFIGTISALFVCYMIYFGFRHIRNIKEKLPIQDFRTFLVVLYIVSTMMSIGLPFIIPGFEPLLDFTGPFKQFRSIGRVSWVSFYAINFLALPWLFHKISMVSDTAKKTVLYFGVSGMFLFQCISYFRSFEIYQNDLPQFTVAEKSPYGIEPSEYQAILPNPYFSAGPESFNWFDQAENIGQSLAISYSHHIPIMAINMSRTGMMPSILQNAIVAKPYEVPAIIDTLRKSDSRPILVIESKLDVNMPMARINHWTDGASVVYENDAFKLKRLELSAFDSIVRDYHMKLDSFVFSDTISIQLEKKKSQREWGYENYIEKDIAPGEYMFKFTIDAKVQGDIASLTEIFQFDQQHKLVDKRIEANRFYYERIHGTEITTVIKFNVLEKTKKLVFRIFKENQKEKDEIKISQAMLIKI